MLYASLGEDADPCGAQDFTILKGCILRLKVDALADTFGFTVPKPDLVPPDNPFVTNPNNNAKLTFAKGLRNPFRFHIDPADGHLYIADVGQNIWEEIDECVGGENFGWPQYEGSVAYSVTRAPARRGGQVPHRHLQPLGLRQFVDHQRHGLSPGARRPVQLPGQLQRRLLLRRVLPGVAAPDPAGHQRRLAVRAERPGQPNATDWATATTNCSDFLVGPDGGLYYVKQFSSPSVRRIVYTGANSGVGDADGGARPPLLAVFPNPVAGHANTVRLQFTLQSAGDVRLDLFDAAGRHVRALRAGSMDAGPGEALGRHGRRGTKGDAGRLLRAARNRFGREQGHRAGGGHGAVIRVVSASATRAILATTGPTPRSWLLSTMITSCSSGNSARNEK